MKSRHRVKTYGEVFTPRHMVNRVLDLVREELEAGAHSSTKGPGRLPSRPKARE